MNTKFYLKTIRGFELIEIVSIDYDNQLVKFQFPNGNDVLEQAIQRIVQLEVIPVKINN